MIPSHHFTYLDGYCESQPTDVLQQRPEGGLVWNSLPRQDSNCRQFHFYVEIPGRSDRISGNLPWFALFLELTNTFLGRWEPRDCRLLGRIKTQGREGSQPGLLLTISHNGTNPMGSTVFTTRFTVEDHHLWSSERDFDADFIW